MSTNPNNEVHTREKYISTLESGRKDHQLAYTEDIYDKGLELHQSVINANNKKSIDKLVEKDTTILDLIDAKDKAINAKIDANDKAINEKVDKNDKLINEKVDKIKADTDRVIADNKSEINTRVDKEVATLNTIIEANKQEAADNLRDKAAELKKNIDDNDAAINIKADTIKADAHNELTTQTKRLDGKIDSINNVLTQAIENNDSASKLRDQTIIETIKEDHAKLQAGITSNTDAINKAVTTSAAQDKVLDTKIDAVDTKLNNHIVDEQNDIIEVTKKIAKTVTDISGIRTVIDTINKTVIANADAIERAFIEHSKDVDILTRKIDYVDHKFNEYTVGNFNVISEIKANIIDNSNLIKDCGKKLDNHIKECDKYFNNFVSLLNDRKDKVLTNKVYDVNLGKDQDEINKVVFATKTALDKLIGADDVTTAIDTFNEVTKFLANYSAANPLQSIIDNVVKTITDDVTIKIKNVSGSVTDLTTKITENAAAIKDTKVDLQNQITKEANDVDAINTKIDNVQNSLTNKIDGDIDALHKTVLTETDAIIKKSGITQDYTDNALKVHNSDSTAHQDIRKNITDLEKTVETNKELAKTYVDSQVATATQHSDKADAQLVTSYTKAIDAHNKANDAHQDIREAIKKNETNLESNNAKVTEVTTIVNDLKSKVNDTEKNVTTLQTKVDNIEKGIDTIKQDITKIQSMVNGNEIPAPIKQYIDSKYNELKGYIDGLYASFEEIKEVKGL